MANCSNSAPQCYDFAGEPPSLGCYIDCVLPQIFDVISIIGVAVAIGLTLWLIFQTIKNAEDQEFLQTVGKRWVLLIVFIIIIATRGGIIFIPLKFLGFEGLSAYDSFYQGLIDMLDVTRKEVEDIGDGNGDIGDGNGDIGDGNGDIVSKETCELLTICDSIISCTNPACISCYNSGFTQKPADCN